MRFFSKLYVLCTIFALFSIPIFSQEKISKLQAIILEGYEVSGIYEGDLGSAIQTAIFSSLRSEYAEVTQAPPLAEVLQAAGLDEYNEKDLIRYSASRGYHLLISPSFTIESNRVLIIFKVYFTDPANFTSDDWLPSLILGRALNTRESVSIYDDIDQEIKVILTKFNSSNELIIDKLNNPEKYITTAIKNLRFLSDDEGMQIGFNGTDIIMGEIIEGALMLESQPLALDQEISLEKTKTGYYSDIESVLITAGQSEYPLSPLFPKTSFHLDIAYNAVKPLGFGLGVKYLFVPDRYYVRFTNDLYLQYSFVEGARPVYHWDSFLTAGGYLFSDPWAGGRFSLDAGFGTAFTILPIPDSEDPLEYLRLDLFLRIITLRYEFNWPDYAIFIESSLNYSLGILPNAAFNQGVVMNTFFIPFSGGLTFKW
jgi:hypothetical protein